MTPQLHTLPCARCGAPMAERAGRATDVEVGLDCPFCAAHETLPADLALRVIALRVRGDQRRWAEDAARGPALALMRAFEGPALRALTGGFGALVVMSVAGFGITMLGRSRVDRAALVTPVTSIAIVVGAAVGLCAAAIAARRRFRRVLAPIVGARVAIGLASARICRRCGAELPLTGHAAFLRCAYCSADNLVAPDALAERARLLDSATERQLRAAADTRAAVGRLVPFASTVLTLGVFAGAGVAGALVTVLFGGLP